MYLLTIAIPTYNRADKLNNSLENLLSSCADNEKIEILVSDNASTDRTQELMNGYFEKYECIHYYRNEKNYGFDINFLNCLEKAKGEYVWLLGDDDIVTPNTIDSILMGCKMNPVCMHLNSSSMSDDNTVEHNSIRFKDQGFLKFFDKNEFVEKIGIYCTFVSSLVYKKEYLDKIEDKRKYIGTNILQSHIFFECMKNEGVYIINSKNCVIAQKNYEVHYDVFRTWITSYSDLFLITAPDCGFNVERMRKVLERDLSSIIYGFVILYRQTCINESEWDRESIWSRLEEFPCLIKKYKIAINCPVCFLKILSLMEKVRRVLRGS